MVFTTEVICSRRLNCDAVFGSIVFSFPVSCSIKWMKTQEVPAEAAAADISGCAACPSGNHVIMAGIGADIKQD
jgi:hypothetical protein